MYGIPRNVFHVTRLGEINSALDNLIDSNCITADQVNTIVNHLGSLFIHSATSAFWYF